MSPPPSQLPGRRLHVFHLIKGLGRGGAERLLSEGLRFADRQRFEHSYGYFLPGKDALVEDLRTQGVEVRCFPARSAAGILWKSFALGRFLRDRRPDLVHCHLPLAGVTGRLAGRWAEVPVIYTEHNLLERYHPWTRRANLWTWRLQRRVLAVSGEVADSIHRHTSDRIPVEVVPNGIDVDAFEPDPEAALEIRRRWGIPPTAPVVGQVAVFRRQKRLDLWLEAAAEIRRQHPDARFLLVGDGPTRSEIETLAHRLGLDEALVLTGLHKDVAPLLGAMDVFLLSSDYEGLPLAILEAMAARRPVVATEVGGIPEAMREERGEPAGVLVPPRRPAESAEAVSQLLSDPRRRRKLGNRAYDRVAARFSLARMTAQLESVYRRALAETGREATR